MKKDSKTKIANTYGVALYEAAQDKKAIDAVYSDVKLLIDLMKSDADFIKFLANPLLDAQAKKEVLKEIATKIKLSKETVSCLDVIVDNNRVIDFPAICAEFVKIYYSKHNIEEVDVLSAVALSDKQEKMLVSKLEKKLNKKIVVNCNLDTNILGGLQIKYGSVMIDDSIASKLGRIENLMKGE